MRIEQLVLSSVDGAGVKLAPLAAIAPQLVSIFGSVSFLTDAAFVRMVTDLFPDAQLMGCTTAGEISNDGVTEDTCTVTAVRFSTSRVKSVSTALKGMKDSRAAGERIGHALDRNHLRGVLMLAPGVKINGSALVEGVSSVIGQNVPLTGGLAGDDGAFHRTLTWGDEGVSDNHVTAVGFYGDTLNFISSAFGGWVAFGPERRITKCDGNVLYELDGRPALDVYRRFLGNYAKDLPASGLLFPFSTQGAQDAPDGLIRSILGVDEKLGSLTLAGEVPMHGNLQLMRANKAQLIQGARTAAESAKDRHEVREDDLTFLISCVGRKLVMGDRVAEEVEAVRGVFDRKPTVAGFYSYGEISPFTEGGACHLHNQTMTIVAIGERSS
ncbi:MAG: hypothetical protein RLZZ371_1756 [Pseudomonadota bacterium]